MNITVKVTDLKKMVQELADDKAEYVEISIIEGDEYVTTFVNFEAYEGHGAGLDYGNIKHVDVDPYYKESNWEKV